MNRNVDWAAARQEYITTHKSLETLADEFNSSGRSMRRHCLDEQWKMDRILYRQQQQTNKSVRKLEKDVKDDRMVLTLTGDTIITLDQALEAADVDLAKWEVERFVTNVWQVTARNRDVDLQYTDIGVRGHVKETPGMLQRANHQIKVWLKPKQIDLGLTLEAVEEAFAKIGSFEPLDLSDAVRFIDKGKGLIEISMPDLHLGKLSWGEETGHGDGDLGTILLAAKDTIMALTAKAAYYAPERIVLVVGNDLLHVDNLESSTTKGTLQDTDSRPQKVFDAAVGFYRMAIGLLRRIAPVDVVMVPGNHDQYTIPHLGSALAGCFHQDSGVTVDNSVRSRKYYRFGPILLGYCHGDKDDPKLEDLPLLMMRENQEIISEIRWMEWHVGHIHRRREMSWQSLESDTGIQVRVLPALCVPDAWHAKRGFVGHHRAVDMYMWDKEKGYQGHVTHNYIEREEGE